MILWDWCSYRLFVLWKAGGEPLPWWSFTKDRKSRLLSKEEKVRGLGIAACLPTQLNFRRTAINRLICWLPAEE
jgi:hypothetical protein